MGYSAISYTILFIPLVAGLIVNIMPRRSLKLVILNASYLALYALFTSLLLAHPSPIICNFLTIRNAILLNSTSIMLLIILTFCSHMLLLGFIMNRTKVLEKLDSILLMLFATYGIIMSNNLIMLLLFMEIALATTTFVLLSNKKSSLEATLKMVIMLVLGGIFMIVGLGGLYTILRGAGMNISDLSFSFFSSSTHMVVPHAKLLLNMILLSYLVTLVGICIETGLVPFYMWLPDVYSGPSASSSALFILLIDTADLYALLRLSSLYGFLFSSYINLKELVTNTILIFSIASFVLGELSALTQRRLRRIFGYSGVADAGYTLLLSACLALSGIPLVNSSSLLATATFFIMFSNIALSNIISLIGLAEEKGISNIDEIRGLPWKLPLLSTNLVISLLSLAGAPPLAGFIAKFFVISAIVSNLEKVVAIIAAIFFGVSAAYVLRVITTLLSRPTRPIKEKEQITPLLPFLIVNLVLLICGISPGLVLKFMMR